MMKDIAYRLACASHGEFRFERKDSDPDPLTGVVNTMFQVLSPLPNGDEGIIAFFFRESDAEFFASSKKDMNELIDAFLWSERKLLKLRKENTHLKERLLEETRRRRELERSRPLI